MRTSTKITAVVGGAALSVATAGVAFAYWTTSGSGSGTGSTTAGTADSLTFTQNPAGAADTSVDLAPMFPGDSSQSLTVRVRNDSDESAYVANVAAYITTSDDDCTGADFLLGATEATATAAPSTLAGARALTWTAADLAAGAAANATGVVQFNNTASDQDACKGVVVTLHYVAS